MAKKFLTAIDLAKNELQNPVAGNLAAAPSSPVKGQFYFNSTDNILYWYNGTGWVAAQGGAAITAGGGLTLTGSTLDVGAGTGITVAADTVSLNTTYTDGRYLQPATADTTYVNVAGEAMTGLLTLSADPSAALGAATKQYVDNLVTGLAWSDTVRAATTANITLSAAQSIDGVSVAVNDRVLVKNQTTASTNGVYIVQSGAWTRSADADAEAELLNMAVWVSEGTTQADTAWVCTTNAPITVGTTNLTWAQFAGGGTITAGAGLTQTGNVLDVGAGTGITVAADTVALDTAYTDSRYAAAAAGAKRFAVDVGGATSQVITHNLATLDVLIQVYRKATPFDVVECDVEHTTTNTATLRFTVAPAAAEYRAVVLA